MSKEELLNNVRNWITIDNEIRTLQKEQKLRREKKKVITDNLIEFMKTNEIDCFDVKDGQLVYTKNKTKKPLSKKYILLIIGIVLFAHSRCVYWMGSFHGPRYWEKVFETTRRFE